VLFEASWCGWCKKMKTNLNNESIKNLFAKNYVFVNLTVLESKNNKHLENPGAEDLLNQFGGENQGIPYYLIFSNQGQLLADSKMIKDKEVLIGEGENIGCPEADFEIDAFIYKIQETSNLNSNELMLIAKQFASTNH
jgi:thiol-disulfide isomerase/thioredoxin